jgi:hypothetical protein
MCDAEEREPAHVAEELGAHLVRFPRPVSELLPLWDESVLEKPESISNPDLGSARSSETRDDSCFHQY